MTPPRYFCNLPLLPQIHPNDAIPAVGVMADPLTPRSIIGIAYPYSHLGGPQLGDSLRKKIDLPEVIWRITLDRMWVDGQIRPLAAKEILPGRFVIREGEFYELAEEAY